MPITRWQFLIGTVLLMLGLQFVQQQNWLALSYDRGLVEQGEFWRLITGHLVHSNIPHLMLNLGALCFVALLVPGQQALLLAQIPVIALISSVIFFVFEPQLASYVGLSGVLHGLLLVGAVLVWPQERMFACLLTAGVVLKLLWEQSYLYDRQSVAELIEIRVAIEAHIWGAAAGAVVALALQLRPR